MGCHLHVFECDCGRRCEDDGSHKQRGQSQTQPLGSQGGREDFSCPHKSGSVNALEKEHMLVRNSLDHRWSNRREDILRTPANQILYIIINAMQAEFPALLLVPRYFHWRRASASRMRERTPNPMTCKVVQSAFTAPAGMGAPCQEPTYETECVVQYDQQRTCRQERRPIPVRCMWLSRSISERLSIMYR
jgi:hypothetical protein